MDKTAIKNFAIWARNKLKSDIKVRAGFMGITESGIASPLPASTSDIQYFDVASSEPVKLQGREIEMRKRIVSKLEQHAKESGYQTAYDSLIENMASEWFNRLIAIRYMEVNDYFSDGLRMLSSDQTGKQDPDIVSRPFDSDLEFTDAERTQINDWMDHNKADNLFRFLLLKRCNQLAESLPGLFEEAGDASEFFLRLGFVQQRNVEYYYETDNGLFQKMPNSTISYWVSENVVNDFSYPIKVEDISETRIGMATANNDLFMRNWFEVSNENIGFDISSREQSINSGKKWFPYCKGGSFRKWYGNLSFVVNWENDGYEIQNFRDKKTGRVRSHNYNLEYIFKPGLTFTAISSSNFACRFMNQALFGSGGSGICNLKSGSEFLLLGLLNSKIVEYLLGCLSPTMNFEVNTVGSLPYICGEDEIKIIGQVKELVQYSSTDWNSYEDSWGFKRHPLISAIVSNRMLFDDISNIDLAECYMAWKQECEERFLQLKVREEELNRIFIDIYGLQDELKPDVVDKDITVHRIYDSKNDVPESMQGSSYVRTMRDEIVSLLSYAVGCMLGRYCLDAEGLAYAGGEWDASKYSCFLPDEDNVILITDQKYMDDDIVERLCEFLKVVYGEKSLETNLDFIANALGGKGSISREIIRNYFLNDFFKDHCKTYQKRPIYWLFDSGKQNGFKALVYMHRWNQNCIGRVLVYLHKIQEKYEIEVRAIDAMLEHMTDKRQQASEEKRRDHLLKQIAEIKEYDERLDHMANEHVDIDLDDGVKVNYEKVQTDRNGTKFNILATIK